MKKVTLQVIGPYRWATQDRRFVVDGRRMGSKKHRPIYRVYDRGIEFKVCDLLAHVRRAIQVVLDGENK